MNRIPHSITRIVNVTGHFPLAIFLLSDKYFPRIASLWLSQSRICPTTHIAAAIGTNTSPGGCPLFNVASRIHILIPIIAQATCNHRSTLLTRSVLKLHSRFIDQCPLSSIADIARAADWAYGKRNSRPSQPESEKDLTYGC